MISQETIDEAVRRLVKAYNPLEIYLFGRYAWSTPDDDDDLELLVVIESSNVKYTKRGHLAFDTLFSLEIPKTVIIRTKEEFNRQSENISDTLYEIKHRGKVVYARG